MTTPATSAITIVPPTCEQLYNWSRPEGLRSVHREVDDSWRHGSRVTQVFHRAADDTYWEAQYRLSTDQETNELREGLAEIFRVYPRSVTVTHYVVEPPE